MKPTYEQLEERNRLLEREVSLYKTIIDNVPISVFAKDVQDNYRYLIWNKQLEKVFGLKSSEIIGIHDYDLFKNKDEADYFRNYDISVMEGKKIVDIPSENLSTVDGVKVVHTRKIPIYDEQGQAQILLGCLEDITQQTQIQQELVESEERYRKIIETTSKGFCSVDMNGNLVDVNPAYCQMSGYTKEELLLLNVFDLKNSESSDSLKQRLQVVRERGHDTFETVHKHKDGTLYPVEITVSYFPYQDGQFLSFIDDITLRKQVEKTLKNNELQLLELNAHKDKLFSIIAHDLKSPFSALLGFSELLSENIRKFDTDKLEKYATIIHATTRQTFHLLEDLLLWSRVQSNKMVYEPQEIVFSELCQEIIDGLQHHAQLKNIGVHYFEADYTAFHADLNMLKTILRNLISNAIKFTNPEGTIHIYTKKNSDILTVTVADNGIGIASESLSKLWDFSQQYSCKGTANETGTGFGLILCKEFVEKHGGRIWAESEEGKGSEFKFTIPLKS